MALIVPLLKLDVSNLLPACSALNPVFFIRGIVNVPVVTVFAIELPLMIPVNPEATTAAFAGPPLIFLIMQKQD